MFSPPMRRAARAIRAIGAAAPPAPLATAPRSWTWVAQRASSSSSSSSSSPAPELQLPSEEELLAIGRLLSRPSEAEKRPPTMMPLLTVDAMLPGQRLRFNSADTRLQKFAAENGEVGVLGGSPLGRPLSCGVVAQLTLSSGVATGSSVAELEWVLRGLRHMKLAGPSALGKEGIVMGQVELVDDVVTEADVAEARRLPPLVAEWRGLVEGSRFERFEGQVQGILEDLGPMPPPESAGRLALWVAALINPLPAMGVAYEIRPAALEAPSVAERLKVVFDGIEASIGHVSGREPLF
mmetsp:Transcript_35707/g.90870  ORF Transcript_35707/g.90870 Transcript_35707/m.90870 type:complete len:295 (+) Transcript_35707:53-937(+)